MKTGRNILSTLMVGLIYPAILGSIIYTFFNVFIEYFFHDNTTGFLAQDTLTIILKILSLILVLTFFSIDYIYSSWTKKINIVNFVLDLLILGGMYQIFFLIKLNSKEDLIDYSQLSFSFFGVLILYLIWDTVAFIKRRIDFFRDMIKWELCFGILFLLNGFLTKRIIGNYAAITTIPIIVGAILFFYKYLKIREKTGV